MCIGCYGLKRFLYYLLYIVHMVIHYHDYIGHCFRVLCIAFSIAYYRKTSKNTWERPDIINFMNLKAFVCGFYHVYYFPVYFYPVYYYPHTVHVI